MSHERNAFETMTVSGRGVSISGAGNSDDLYLPIAADIGEGVGRIAIGVARFLRAPSPLVVSSALHILLTEPHSERCVWTK